MKIRYIIIFLLLVMFMGNSFAQKARFFIKSSLVGAGDTRLIGGAVSYFVSEFDHYLTGIYPCASVNSESDVGVFLGHERVRELLGSGDEHAIENIGSALGCDYLVNLQIGTMVGDQFVVSASVIPYRTKFPIIHASAYSQFSANSGHENLKNCEEVARKIVDGLKHTEICAFKGLVKVHVISKREDKQTEEHPVYCNKTDGIYRKTILTDNLDDNNWDLQKKGIIAVSGNVRFTLNDTTKIEEQDNCHTCLSGREGGRIYTNKTIVTADVQGLSHESQINGIPTDDATVEITFLDDDTYIVKVKATSKKGDKDEQIEEYAEGTCDNINTPPKTISSKADVPLENEIFGPFKGTSKDKILTGKNTIKRIDSATKEETTITYEFNLKRD